MYRSVVLKSECPAIRMIAMGDMPAAAAFVIPVCRQSWILQGGSSCLDGLQTPVTVRATPDKAGGPPFKVLRDLGHRLQARTHPQPWRLPLRPPLRRPFIDGLGRERRREFETATQAHDFRTGLRIAEEARTVYTGPAYRHGDRSGM
jgi:hypothetical protein